MTYSIKERNFSSEFEISASRSSGAGGQNVNKVNTKVELRFNIDQSIHLSDTEKAILRDKLSNKLTQEGYLIITSQTERTQIGNKVQCINKFYDIIEAALKVKKKRKPTRPTLASKALRIKQKKQRSEIKQMRSKPIE